MTHRLISLFIAMVLTVSYVAASGLQIAGVYYDPTQAESGSEAIQLENNGTSPVALENVLLVTKQSTYPLPPFTLLPGQGYLVADMNWSTLRDNTSWPLADLELPLSLANTEGFVELIENGTIIDLLAWNSSFKAREGKMLTPLGEAAAVFRNSASTALLLEATLLIIDAPPTVLNVTVTDDAPAAGVQLLSYTRVIRVQAQVLDANSQDVNVSVSWLGETYVMAKNGSTFTAFVPFSSVAPGQYTLTVTATDGVASSSQTQQVTVVASTSVTTSGPLLLQGAPGQRAEGSFVVFNSGNVVKEVTLQHTLPNATCDVAAFVLAPEDERTVTCALTIPPYAPGEYLYHVKIVVS